MEAAARAQGATAADLDMLEHHEVIGGVIHEKASPSFEHGDAQGHLILALGGFFGRGIRGPGGWWIGTEVEIELETHEVYLPDVAGWRRDRVPERPSGRPVRIRPDWVCEILSPSTAARDMGPKRDTYHRCGVGHYWIVDLAHGTLSVYRWHEHGYVLARVAGRSERVRAEPFERIEIDVGALFGDEPAGDDSPPDGTPQDSA